MPHEVIMPALGVAQDTGMIIAWLKQSGDAIKMGDALMEIETDKAVVELEAQADGYLTNVSAAAGDHVPVGQVVGLISESAEVEAGRDGYVAAILADAQQEVPVGSTLAFISTSKAQGNVASSLNTAMHNGMRTESAPTVLRIDMRVAAKADIEFIDWMRAHKGLCVPARMTWLRYATAALRVATDQGSGCLVVELRHVQRSDGCYADADHSRLSEPLTTNSKQAPNLILRDCSATRITSITTAAANAPIVTIIQKQDDYLVSLDYRTDHLDENTAMHFIADFSSRLAQPLRQLL